MSGIVDFGFLPRTTIARQAICKANLPRGGNKTVREMEARIRELERHLGRQTLENGILQEALDKSRSKKQTLLAQSLKLGGSQ